MIPIKHILYENGVEEIFKLIVPSGNFQGEYVVEKPSGWDEMDSIVDIDEELFFVKNFIIGDNSKLKFYQYGNKAAYDILEKVYEEQKGDGRIIFKWIGKKDNIEYDLLKDNFEVNMNKYNQYYGNSMFIIDVEIIKSEAQNKLFNREDVTVDIFSEKDLDENIIDPVETFTIGYKKSSKKQSNFYFWDTAQPGYDFTPRSDQFFSFVRSDNFEFGNNTNEYCGFKTNLSGVRVDQGPFVSTNITLKSIKIEVSNMHVTFGRGNEFPSTPKVYLCAVISGPNFFYSQNLEESTDITGTFGSEIKIDNRTFNLNINGSSDVTPGQNLSFMFLSNDISDKFIALSNSTNTNIEITTNQESPLVQTKGVRIIDAIKQVVKNYTASELGVISNYIGVGGSFYNSSISTGVYLRGLPSIYSVGQKIKTSLKSLITEGTAKLLALGYDIINNNVVIEGIDYFFKDIQVYDLSQKNYINQGFKINSDKDVTFNQLIFGSKKISKNRKEDIQNFVTSAEFSTPIASLKNKFDKQTDLIIDEYKIQELIEDNSSSTNDNDDDLVLIDMVGKTDYWDSGVFDNCQHSIKNGLLVLTCFSPVFETTMMQVGSQCQITEGYNSGTYTILSINGPEMTLNKTTAIETGNYDTPIRYLIPSLIKNRSTADGFINYAFVRDPETSTNSRHNPKYHMSRWFPFFGSGLRTKSGDSLLKVNNYKNNSKAKMEINSPDLVNELPGLIEVGESEQLHRLRQFKQPFFSGDMIEISFSNVTFEEFIMIYENWRYGLNDDRMQNRGYIKINSPIGILDVYPFGNAAFSHDRKNNVLSIKGKTK